MINRINLQGTKHYKVTYNNGRESTVAKNTTGAVIDEINEFIANGGEIEPEFTQGELDQQTKDTRIAEIDTRLAEIDIASIRSMRAKSNARDSQTDRDKLITLDNEAITLRDERDSLIQG